MSRTLFTVSPVVYLADTSSIVRLDGLDGNPAALPFSASEQTAIWKELEDLCRTGRLKLIKQVKGELKRYNPNGLARLRQYSGHRLPIDKTDPMVVKLYGEITTNHPDLLRGGSRKDHGDPWLILAAELYGYQIITEELLQIERATTLPLRRQRIEKIPDICQTRKLEPAVHLRDLAIKLGWIT
jgi:hypothetical protein